MMISIESIIIPLFFFFFFNCLSSARVFLHILTASSLSLSTVMKMDRGDETE
ncbi:hypothetical protein Scep_016848 [Stephania cephalantha]|uniref:Uncharacterized protein n=1 Tax=Stephania cephalantha TaxID=152367 RepID=A0AAP0IPD3_9MAGN